MKAPDLFIGIPTWNSARFLEPCLRQIEATCGSIRYQVGIVDNVSTDATVAIARAHGAWAEVRESSMPDALNRLVSRSRARFTLFMHSDTMLLDPEWFPRCTARLTGTTEGPVGMSASRPRPRPRFFGSMLMATPPPRAPRRAAGRRRNPSTLRRRASRACRARAPPRGERCVE